MYLFSRGSGSTNRLERYSKGEDPAAGINLSAESNVGISSGDSDIRACRRAPDNDGFCYVEILLGDASKNVRLFPFESELFCPPCH